MLFILLFAIKLLPRLSIFKYIEKKHGRLVLENVRSLEKAKRKWFKISKDINFIKTCKIENLLPTFAKVKLAIKSGNKKIQRKTARIIMNMELQQKYHEKHKLKREIIQLSMKLKAQVGLVLFNGVIYSFDKSIKQKSIAVPKHHEKKLVKLQKDKRLTFGENIKYIRHTVHSFSSYQLSSKEEEALSFGLDEHILSACNRSKL